MRVRPGGRLVYATCSPLPLEDEQVIERFLREVPGFALLPPARTLGDDLAARLDCGPTLRPTAHRHGTGYRSSPRCWDARAASGIAGDSRRSND